MKVFLILLFFSWPVQAQFCQPLGDMIVCDDGTSIQPLDDVIVDDEGNTWIEIEEGIIVLDD